MRQTDTTPHNQPRNAHAAARQRQQLRHHGLIDIHNARFAARFAVQMIVLFLAVLLFSIIVAAILGAWHDTAGEVLNNRPSRFR